MSDQRFFDLAMKAIAQQASDAERAELEALLARQPELRAELARLQGDVRLAKDALPLMEATQASASEFPAYARERLQTTVRQTLGRLESPPLPASDEKHRKVQPGLLALPELAPSLPTGGEERRMMWRWRWLLCLAAATAVIALVAIPLLRQAPAPVIQIAMLDPAGASRGADSKELALFQHTWANASVDLFSAADKVRTWETNWPGDTRSAVAKILYDRPAGELRVLGRYKGKPFSKTWVVEQDLAAALTQARAFVQEQTSR
jgi:hypothetical protein